MRFRKYLFVILMISSSTNGILESLWRVLLLTYHGALNTILSVWKNIYTCNFVHGMFSCVYVSSLAGRRSCSSVHFVGLHHITDIYPMLGKSRFHITQISYLACPSILHLSRSVIF